MIGKCLRLNLNGRKPALGETLALDSIGELMSVEGCTFKQMQSMEKILASVEHELLALHMQILTLRGLAYCDSKKSFEKFAETVFRSSSDLLTGIYRQHDSVAVLVGKAQAKRRAET